MRSKLLSAIYVLQIICVSGSVVCNDLGMDECSITPECEYRIYMKHGYCAPVAHESIKSMYTQNKYPFYYKTKYTQKY